MAAFLKRALTDALRQVADLKPKELIEQRHARLNSYGRFIDTKADARSAAPASARSQHARHQPLDTDAV